MIYFYTANGRIRASADAAISPRPQPYMVSGRVIEMMNFLVTDQEVDIDQYWIQAGALTPRTPVPYTVNSVVVDLSESVVITTSPGVRANIISDQSDASVITPDGVIELEFEIPGDYLVELQLDPHSVTEIGLVVHG